MKNSELRATLHIIQPVDEFHGLHGEHRRDDVVRVVLPPGNRHEAVAMAANEDEAALCGWNEVRKEEQ